MPSIEFDDDRPPRSRDELLAAVRRDGLRRRYRRNGLFGGLALVLVGALAVPVVAGGDGQQRKVAAVDQPTSTVEETTTTVAIIEEPATTLVAAPDTTAGARTTTSLLCRNSTDPRCGPFRWDPEAGPNADMDITITVSPKHPSVGETVTFTVTAVDPDVARIVPGSDGCWPPFYGDEAMVSSRCMASCSVQERYGPWTPPPRQRGELTRTYTHVYSSPGDYNTGFAFFSDKDTCESNPYASYLQKGYALSVS